MIPSEEPTCPKCDSADWNPEDDEGKMKKPWPATNFRHGAYGSPIYRSWQHMKQRCINPQNSRWGSYGGKGIKVCDRWMEFNNFLADMGNRPEGTSLDRFPDKHGNYEPGNCRWANPKQQTNNMRNSQLLTMDGKTLPLPEWAELYGIKYATLNCRIWRGWDVEKAIKTPVEARNYAGK